MKISINMYGLGNFRLEYFCEEQTILLEWLMKKYDITYQFGQLCV